MTSREFRQLLIRFWLCSILLSMVPNLIAEWMILPAVVFTMLPFTLAEAGSRRRHRVDRGAKVRMTVITTPLAPAGPTCGHTLATPVMEDNPKVLSPELLLMAWYCPDCDEQLPATFQPPAPPQPPAITPRAALAGTGTFSGEIQRVVESADARRLLMLYALGPGEAVEWSNPARYSCHFGICNGASILRADRAGHNRYHADRGDPMRFTDTGDDHE